MQARIFKRYSMLLSVLQLNYCKYLKGISITVGDAAVVLKSKGFKFKHIGVCVNHSSFIFYSFMCSEMLRSEFKIIHCSSDVITLPREEQPVSFRVLLSLPSITLFSIKVLPY